jgi:hypothetical protein
MRRLIAILFILTTASLVRAADEPKPNTLTPKEIADGWILLFDGETTFGWEIQGEAQVDNGSLVVGGDKESRLHLTTAFDECVLEGEWRVEGRTATGSWAKDAPEIDFAKYRDDEKGWGRLSITVKERQVDQIVQGAAGKRVFRIENGLRGKNNSPNTPMPPTKPTFTVPAGSKLILRSLKLKPMQTKALFNGKDLTGWKKYEGDNKRNKTEISVTKDGFLHLKNGPGDLQSEKQFDDFVLQAECRTNGKNLNSGVFFRCIPGDYQNGYEAQIHNGFADTPKEYIVEEFDPKTHELKGKAKVKSAAVDYGTGAVYRRVPARTHAARDGEWFTMTVVAQGRHVATWVNGVQQVDWTDNRPANANPRNGFRQEKGPVSLQGHDATTDIDFRSIRAVALPKAAGD